MEDNRELFKTKLFSKILVIAGVDNMDAHKLITPNNAPPSLCGRESFPVTRGGETIRPSEGDTMVDIVLC